MPLRTYSGVRRFGRKGRVLSDAHDVHQGLQPGLRVRRPLLREHLRRPFARCFSTAVGSLSRHPPRPRRASRRPRRPRPPPRPGAPPRLARQVEVAAPEVRPQRVLRDCSAAIARRNTAARSPARAPARPSQRCAPKSGHRSADATTKTTATTAWHTRTAPRFDTAGSVRVRRKQRPAPSATSAAPPVTGAVRRAYSASTPQTQNAGRRRGRAPAKRAPRHAPPTTTRFADAMARPTRTLVRPRPPVCRFGAKAPARPSPSADRPAQDGKFAFGSANS